jgi:MFS family permease
MSPPPDPAALARTVRLYPIYAAAFNAFFWLPVFFLFFLSYRGFSLPEVIQLGAVYYACVVAAEVPSGYLSDRLGRKLTLVISAVAIALAHALFLAAPSFALVALAQALLALGVACNSGTDTSLHYDALEALGRSHEYDRREAVTARNSFLSNAGAALLGGLAFSFHPLLAYLLSFAAALATLSFALSFAEPPQERSHLGFARQIRHSLSLLCLPRLRWLFLFSVLMTVLNHIPYEFYQPYLDLLADELPNWAASNTGTLSGTHAALALVIAAVVSAHSIRIRDKIGERTTLLIATALQGLIILSMATWLHWGVAAFALLRSAPRALMTAPLNSAISPLVPSSQRATYFSIQSLVGRLSFSAFLASMALLVSDENSRRDISMITAIGAALAVVGLLVLALAARSPSPSPPAAPIP